MKGANLASSGWETQSFLCQLNCTKQLVNNNNNNYYSKHTKRNTNSALSKVNSLRVQPSLAIV